MFLKSGNRIQHLGMQIPLPEYETVKVTALEMITGEGKNSFVLVTA